jgi:hypothetical protein
MCLSWHNSFSIPVWIIWISPTFRGLRGVGINVASKAYATPVRRLSGRLTFPWTPASRVTSPIGGGFQPAMGASARPRLKRRGQLGWLCEHKAQVFMLHSDAFLDPLHDGSSLLARVVLRAGEKRSFSISYAMSDILVQAPLGTAAEERVRVTLNLHAGEQRLLVGLGKTVCEEWRRPDQGIWEVRGGGRHHTHSKVLCWATLDRLLRMHSDGLLRRVPVQRFTREREAIAAAVEANGYDSRKASYVDAFDSSELDAALVLLARYGYRGPSDPRMSSTFARLDAELGTADGFWYRYRRRAGSPFRSHEGVFQACGFWAFDYLALRGDQQEAERRFERLLEARNDLGLLSEEFDPGAAACLGNFPQALSHLALVTAALSLAAGKAEDGGRSRAP